MHLKPIFNRWGTQLSSSMFSKWVPVQSWRIKNKKFKDFSFFLGFSLPSRKLDSLAHKFRKIGNLTAGTFCVIYDFTVNYWIRYLLPVTSLLLYFNGHIWNSPTTIAIHKSTVCLDLIFRFRCLCTKFLVLSRSYFWKVSIDFQLLWAQELKMIQQLSCNKTNAVPTSGSSNHSPLRRVSWFFVGH